MLSITKAMSGPTKFQGNHLACGKRMLLLGLIESKKVLMVIPGLSQLLYLMVRRASVWVLVLLTTTLTIFALLSRQSTTNDIWVKALPSCRSKMSRYS